MNQKLVVRSLPQAYQIIKEINGSREWDGEYRSAAREALVQILEACMHDRVCWASVITLKIDPSIPRIENNQVVWLRALCYNFHYHIHVGLADLDLTPGRMYDENNDNNKIRQAEKREQLSPSRTARR